MSQKGKLKKKGNELFVCCDILKNTIKHFRQKRGEMILFGYFIVFYRR